MKSKQIARASLYHLQDLSNQMGTHRLLIADFEPETGTFTVRHGASGNLEFEYDGFDGEEARRIYKARLANYLENSMSLAVGIATRGDWILPGDLSPEDRAKLDDITARKCAFQSFQDLLDAPGGYFPTLNIADRELRLLADAYDDQQERRNDTRRAFRRYTLKGSQQ